MRKIENILNKINFFPIQIRNTICRYKDRFNLLEEIRIRANKNIILKIGQADVVLEYVASQEELLQILQIICDNSIYSYQNQICNGYITLRGGHRVGIAGNVVVEDGKVKNIYTKHILENGSQKELRFEEESSGTRKIFSILPVILNVIKSGNLLVIDELDAKLHPVLLQRIIEMFTNPMINTKGAQLLFTSHDLTTMNNKVFRRDEIWFSAINAYDESV